MAGRGTRRAALLLLSSVGLAVATLLSVDCFNGSREGRLGELQAMAMSREDRSQFKEGLYLFETQRDGVVYDTFFFGSWSGYAHPVVMKHPLSYPETQSSERSGYYEATYVTVRGSRRFVLLKKIQLVRQAILLKAPPTGVEGVRYFRIRASGPGAPGREDLGPEVSLSDTFYEGDYLRICFDERGNATSVEKVIKMTLYSYQYDYDEQDRLRQVVIEKEDGTRSVLQY